MAGTHSSCARALRDCACIYTTSPPTYHPSSSAINQCTFSPRIIFTTQIFANFPLLSLQLHLLC